jgi:hypothetical protein
MANDLFGAKTSSPLAAKPTDGLKPIGVNPTMGGKPMMPSSMGMSTPGMKGGGSFGSMADWTGAQGGGGGTPMMPHSIGMGGYGGMKGGMGPTDNILKGFSPPPSTFPAQPTPQMPQTFPTAPGTSMTPPPQSRAPMMPPPQMRGMGAPPQSRGMSRPMPQMRMPQPSPMQGTFDRGPDIASLLASLFGGGYRG